MAVTKERIVASALEILDTWGLADLSMRRIADGLGVQAASIYWHYANKQALLAAVADEILAPVSHGIAVDLPLPDMMMQWARSLRDALLAHRDAAELVASTLSSDLGSVRPDHIIAEHLDPAWPRSRSRALARAWTHFVLGHVMQEQTRTTMISLGVVVGDGSGRDDAAFEAGVGLLRGGMAGLPS